MDPMNDFQRKPEGSPEKDGEVKKVKHDEAQADTAQHTNGDANGHDWLKDFKWLLWDNVNLL